MPFTPETRILTAGGAGAPGVNGFLCPAAAPAAGAAIARQGCWRCCGTVCVPAVAWSVTVLLASCDRAAAEATLECCAPFGRGPQPRKRARRLWPYIAGLPGELSCSRGDRRRRPAG